MVKHCCDCRMKTSPAFPAVFIVFLATTLAQGTRCWCPARVDLVDGMARSGLLGLLRLALVWNSGKRCHVTPYKHFWMCVQASGGALEGWSRRLCAAWLMNRAVILRERIPGSQVVHSRLPRHRVRVSLLMQRTLRGRACLSLRHFSRPSHAPL